MTKEVLVSVRGLQFVDSEVSQAASDDRDNLSRRVLLSKQCALYLV